jgi:uncharacterized membrane protein YeaQ/YmgE (transglycosylase-associated protein family)
MQIIIFFLIGMLTGWLAGKIMKGKGFGLAGNLIIGVIGALLGGFLFRLLGISTAGFIGSIAMAVMGAIVLLYLIGFIKKQKI